MRDDTSHSIYHMNRVVRRPVFFFCFVFLYGEADRRLCFRYINSTIPLHPKSEISGLWLSSVTAQPGLCRAWSEALKTGILTTRLIYFIAKKKKKKCDAHFST